MKKCFKILVLFLIIFLTAIFGLFSQESQENKDVILLIDISNSMKPVFGDVQNYLINDLVKEVKIGDNVFIIKFYGQSEVAYNKKIESDNDINSVIDTIKKLSATGPFTDIGNALDTLNSELESETYLNNKKYVLLLSDGRQEAPQGSKYFTTDLSVSHELLKNVAKEINREGWKIQVLSIGGKEGMKEIAEEMGAAYKETSENPTIEELKEKTADFFKELNFEMDNDLGKLYKNKGVIKGTITSTYDKKVPIIISKISINDLKMISGAENAVSQDELLVNDLMTTIIVNENEKKEIEIPIYLAEKLKPGKYTGELDFTLYSNDIFSPSSFLITFTYPGFIARNLLVLLIAALLLIALIVFTIIKFGYDIKDKVSGIFSSPMKLTPLNYTFIDGTYKTSSKIFFKKDEIKSIGGGSSINIPKIGFENNIAEILYDKKGFHFIIKKNSFINTKVEKEDFINKYIMIKGNNNKTYIIKFTIS